TQNGTIWVKEDGTVEATIYVRQGIFWVEDITSGENVEVLDLKYEDTGESWGGYTERITEVKAKVSEALPAGNKEYKFGTCTEYPTLLGTVQHWDLYLQIDYGSAVEGAFNPNIDKTWTHVYENAEAGTTLSVTTTNEELGEALDSLVFDGGKIESAQAQEDAHALFEASWSAVPEYDIYDLSLKDAEGAAVDLGDAVVSASFPVRDGIAGTHAYQYGEDGFVEAPFISNNLKTGVLTNAKPGILLCAHADYSSDDIFSNASTAPWYILHATDESTNATVDGYASGISGRIYYGNPDEYEMRMRSEEVGGKKVYDFVYWATEKRLRSFMQSTIDEMVSEYKEADPSLSEEAANAKAIAAVREESGMQLTFLGKIIFNIPAESADDRVVLVVDDGASKSTYPLTQSYADGTITATYMVSNYGDSCLGQNIDLIKQAYLHGAASGTSEAPAAYLMLIPAADKVALDPMKVPSQSKRVYTGKPIKGVAVDSLCDIVEGVSEATDAGSYSVVTKPKEGYMWADGTTEPKTLEWNIAQAKLTVSYNKGVKANPTEADLPTAEEITAGMEVTGFVNGETAGPAKDDVAPAADAAKVPLEAFNATTIIGVESNGLTLYAVRDSAKGSAANYSFAYSGKLWKALPEAAMPVVAEDLVYSGKKQDGITINPTTREVTTSSAGGNITRTVTNEYLQLASGSESAIDAGTHTVTLEPKLRCWPDGSLEPREFTYTIAPAELTATYAGETIGVGESPALDVNVEGFVNGETADTAAGYEEPSLTPPASYKMGESYELTPTGGAAKNYAFSSYVPGVLKVENKAESPRTLDPGIYTITANLSLAANDASAAGFTVLAGLAGADGAAYMTNPNNPLGRVDRVTASEGLPTIPASMNARLKVDADGTYTLFLPVSNPIFTLQKLGSNAWLPGATTTTAAVPDDAFWKDQNYGGAYGDFDTRIDSATFVLPDLDTESYTLEGCQFHPTLFAGQPLAGPWNVPMTLSIDFGSAVACSEVAAPKAKTGLVANGSEQTGVPAGSGYYLTGTTKATDPGTYAASATPLAGFAWADGTNSSKLVEWSIAEPEKKYKVTFVDDDGKVLKAATEYKQGTKAADVVKPGNPAKKATAQYTYTFKGWSPAVADVNADATYKAT
ncbi:MAG: hypothetical protein IJ131_01770, partial [Eggerthellaceae bacterium]|nr:hypothetical protein [Eggerthellaceae bacterium]